MKLIRRDVRSSPWHAEISDRQRLAFYQTVIDAVVRPMLDSRGSLSVLDYGCGPSLFTRLLAQDFGDRVRTASADVCRYAVEFSTARNRLFNPRTEGLLSEDVMAPPPCRDFDVILAFAVFEHNADTRFGLKPGPDEALAAGIGRELSKRNALWRRAARRVLGWLGRAQAG